MKTAVLVATLATSANAFTSQKVQKAVKAKMSTHRETLKKTSLSNDKKLTSKVVDEDVEIESHSSMSHFEIVFGDTCDEPVTVEGFTTLICMNEIDNSTSTDGSTADAYSYRFVPDSSGVLAYEYYTGHQCRDFLDGGSLDMMEFGFPSSYVPGTCHDFLDVSGNVMYRGKAGYVAAKHEPHYDYIADHTANKARNCDRDKFIFYNYERSGVCFEDEDDYGNVEYYKMDITNCTSGNVELTFYTDDSCSTMTHKETEHVWDCVFDTHEFFSYLEMEGWGEFGYYYFNCGMGAIP
jgi:hypothetical protein